MGEPADRSVVWQERGWPRRRWRRLFVRRVAQAEVLAPDGRQYVVRVVRVLWPHRAGPALDTGSLIDTVDVLPH